MIFHPKEIWHSKYRNIVNIIHRIQVGESSIFLTDEQLKYGTLNCRKMIIERTNDLLFNKCP